jgi:hypothetical protein
MSTAAISVNLSSQQSPGYFQQRRADLQQLSQDLESGNLSAAQSDFGSIQTLAQSGPFGGDAFKVSARQQDLTAIGQALQSGDVAGAQQAFAQLQSTFQPQAGQLDPPSTAGGPSSPAGSSSAPTGSEIVINLGALTPGEQVNINLTSGSNGTEQVSIGVANQQNSSPEQINLNLNANSNQEVVLNLFNGATGSQTSSSNGLSLSA